MFLVSIRLFGRETVIGPEGLGIAELDRGGAHFGKVRNLVTLLDVCAVSDEGESNSVVVWR